MFEIGQVVKARLTGQSVMVIKVYAPPTADQVAVYEVRLPDYRKLQLAEFELQELSMAQVLVELQKEGT